MDTLTPKERSEVMGRVRGKNTGPELRVRQLLHGMGYRYRLHGKGLPGRPDIVFKSRAKVVFVHGCFWHRHKGCEKTRTPRSRLDFWQQKFSDNVARDRRNMRQLLKAGWQVLVVWECELSDEDGLKKKLRRFLDEER